MSPDRLYFRRIAAGITCLWPILFAPMALGNSAGARAQLSGGFQEGSCVTCHAGNGVNEGRVRGGFLQIEGVPRQYEPGRSYPLKVSIAHPGQSRWGFELTSRFAVSGKQAGRLTASDALTQVKGQGEIEYATHTAGGTRRGQADGQVEFLVSWVAPAEPGGLILFNAAGNAADSSDSPTGDFIYTAGNFSRPAPAAAQTPPVKTPPAKAAAAEPEIVDVDAAPVKEPVRVQETPRIGVLPSPVDLKKGSMEFQVQHRFFQSIQDAGWGDAIGIDSGANISLGFHYGLTDRLSVGIARARTDKVVEMRGTYELKTAKESAWKFSLQGGVEGYQNFTEHYAPFLQFASSFDHGPFRLNLVPTVVFNSRPDALMEYSRNQAINPDSNSTFSLGIGTDIALHRRVSVVAEYVPRLAGYGGLYKRNDHWATGVAIRTWGHVFSILLSTSRDFMPSKYGVNAEDREVSLGFNIYRRIR